MAQHIRLWRNQTRPVSVISKGTEMSTISPSLQPDVQRGVLSLKYVAHKPAKAEQSGRYYYYQLNGKNR